MDEILLCYFVREFMSTSIAIQDNSVFNLTDYYCYVTPCIKLEYLCLPFTELSDDKCFIKLKSIQALFLFTVVKYLYSKLLSGVIQYGLPIVFSRFFFFSQFQTLHEELI